MAAISLKALDKPVKPIAILARGREENPLDLIPLLVLGVVDVVNVTVRKEVVPLQVRKKIDGANILHQGDKG